MPIKTFFIEPTNRLSQSLRRYSRDSKEGTCPSGGWYHNAQTPIEECPEGQSNEFSHDDPRWPTQCQCGYVFAVHDEWQVFRETIYKRADNSVEMTLRNAPDGAMWYADWMLHGRDSSSPDQRWIGPDGHCLVVKVVGGHDWMVDSQCSNCTMKDDKIHKCWVRHGDPKEANITVDKNGNTCSAGGGSILTDKWHGFLRNGMLVE